VTLHLDSSDMVKLFLQESDSAATKRLAGAADELASSRIAYAGVRSAFARKQRDGYLSPEDHRKANSSLAIAWKDYIVVEVTQRIVELAGDLCGTHSLRGMDAIHLASAKLLAQESGVTVRISTSDPRLREAAVAEGLAKASPQE